MVLWSHEGGFSVDPCIDKLGSLCQVDFPDGCGIEFLLGCSFRFTPGCLSFWCFWVSFAEFSESGSCEAFLWVY